MGATRRLKRNQNCPQFLKSCYLTLESLETRLLLSDLFANSELGDVGNQEQDEGYKNVTATSLGDLTTRPDNLVLQGFVPWGPFQSFTADTIAEQTLTPAILAASNDIASQSRMVSLLFFCSINFAGMGNTP